jgi:hypothetical protein
MDMHTRPDYAKNTINRYCIKELNQLENIKKLMKNLKITFEEAAKALGLSDADRERLAAKI